MKTKRRSRWSRILAIVLAMTMVLCDQSVIYASDSMADPVAEEAVTEPVAEKPVQEAVEEPAPEPIAEEPAPEVAEPQPAAETPATEAPKAEIPATEAPATEASQRKNLVTFQVGEGAAVWVKDAAEASTTGTAVDGKILFTIRLNEGYTPLSFQER